jgi:hypothetical protein
MNKARNLRATVTTVVVTVLLLCGTLAASLPVHVVRDHQTITQLLWNQQTGFLMVGMRRDGWSGSGAEFLWQIVRGLLGASFRSEESRTWSVVAHINGGQVRRFVRDNESFQFIESFNGEVYSVSGPPRKWNGREFEPTPDTSSPEFQGRPRTGGPSYSNVNGWSSRINLLNQGNSRFEHVLELTGGKSVVIVDRSNPDRPLLTVLMSNGQTIEILAVDEGFRMTSSGEYADLMRGPLSHQP